METKNLLETWDIDLDDIMCCENVEEGLCGEYIIDVEHAYVSHPSGFDCMWIEVDDRETPSITVRGMKPEDVDADTVYVFANRFTQKEMRAIRKHIAYHV